MKLAILTFQDAVNYGAILQAYALRTALESNLASCEAGVLDYHCEKIRERHLPTYVEKKGNPIRAYLKMLKNYRVKTSRKQKFDRFKNDYLNIIPYTTDSDRQRFLETYDAVVVGSDQVWNLNLTGGDGTYFLKDFRTMKRFSYAASIGETSLSEQEAEQFRSLSALDGVSVREESAKRILNEIIPNPVDVVPDPVLLLDKDAWRRMESAYAGIERGSYVLLYHFHAGASLIAFAKKKAQEYGCKVVCVQGAGKGIDGTTVIRDATPNEFVWLIDHARCVVTNSFHGTMFSVIFNKEFYTETRTNRSTRIIEALTEFRMQNHMLRNGQLVESEQTEENSGRLVEAYRQKGLDYLSRMQRIAEQEITS